MWVYESIDGGAREAKFYGWCQGHAIRGKSRSCKPGRRRGGTSASLK